MGGGDDERSGHAAEDRGELYAVLQRLDADVELLAIVGSWRDTLDDAEVLSMLRHYNAGL